MDLTGIPRKINRQVLRAIAHYMHQKEGSTFPQIYRYVKLCNKRARPGANLKALVNKSLANLQRTGFIVKDNSQHFKVRCPTLMSEMRKLQYARRWKWRRPKVAKVIDTLPNLLSNRRKRKSRDSSRKSENKMNRRKRFSNRKNLNNRKRQKDLPRAKKYKKRSLALMQSSVLEECTSNACAPSKMDLKEISERRKMQNGLNFDNSSTGEPGADDRDSGDEFRVDSIASLCRSEMPDNASRESKMNPSEETGFLADVDQDTAQSDTSKLNYVSFE